MWNNKLNWAYTHYLLGSLIFMMILSFYSCKKEEIPTNIPMGNIMTTSINVCAQNCLNASCTNFEEIPGAIVSVYENEDNAESENESITTVQTNNIGQVRINNLAFGTYFLTCKYKGIKLFEVINASPNAISKVNFDF